MKHAQLLSKPHLQESGGKSQACEVKVNLVRLGQSGMRVHRSVPDAEDSDSYVHNAVTSDNVTRV